MAVTGSARREGRAPSGPAAVADAAHARPILAGALAGSAAVLLVVVALAPRYSADDDVVMQLLLEGGLTGESEPDTFFLSAALSDLIHGLVGIVDAVPWYPIVQFLGLGVVVSTIAAVVLSRRADGVPSDAALVSLAIVAPLVLIRPQFTTTAAMLGFAGVLVVAFAPTRPRHDWLLGALGGVLLGLGALFRLESVVLCAVVGAPALVWIARRHGAQRWLPFLLVAAVAVGAPFVHHRQSYDRPDWQEFIDYNTVRSDLHDSPRAGQLRDLDDETLAAVAWTDNDAELFAEWFFHDPEVYSQSRLTELRDLVPYGVPPAIGWTVNVISEQWPLLVGLAVLGWEALRRRERDQLLVLLGTAGIVVVLIGILLARATMPPRVSLPVFAYLLLLASLLHQPSTEVASPRERPRWPITVLAVVAVASFLVIGVLGRFARVADTEDFDDALVELEALAADGTFVFWDVRMVSIDPFDPPQFDDRVVLSGWFTHSPIYAEQLDRLGIDDVYGAIATDRDTLLVTGDEEDLIVFNRFLAERRPGVVPISSVPVSSTAIVVGG